MTPSASVIAGMHANHVSSSDSSCEVHFEHREDITLCIYIYIYIYVHVQCVFLRSLKAREMEVRGNPSSMRCKALGNVCLQLVSVASAGGN